MEVDDTSRSYIPSDLFQHLFWRTRCLIIPCQYIPINQPIPFLMQRYSLPQRRFPVRRSKQVCVLCSVLCQRSGLYSFCAAVCILHVHIEWRLPSFKMIIRVITDRMTAFDHLLKHLRVLVDVLAYHKERCLHAITLQNLQYLWCYFGNRTVIKGQIHCPTRTENTIRVEPMPYISEFYQANEEAPKIAASLSLRFEMDTGILPFQIGIKFSSIASRIGSMIQ